MSKSIHAKSHGQQQGMAGVLVSALISAALLLIATQASTKVNMDSYHAPNKVNIEVANQLVQAGVRYGNYVIATPTAVDAMITQNATNPAVVLSCQSGQPLPERLQPTQVVTTLNTPQNTQEVQIKAVFAPFDCNLPISATNFRLTFETVGAAGCSTGNAAQGDGCVTRSVVQSAYKGDIYRPSIETVVVPDPVVISYTCPTGPHHMPAPGTPEETGIVAACAAIGVDYHATVHVITEPYDGPISTIADLQVTTGGGGSTTTTVTTTTPTTTTKSSIGN